MPLSDIFDLGLDAGLDLPQFQFAQLPGLELPSAQEAEVAHHRSRQIQRRATAAAVFRDTMGSVTRRSMTRAGEREVTGTFETPQAMPERGQTQDLTADFNVFLSQMGL